MSVHSKHLPISFPPIMLQTGNSTLIGSLVRLPDNHLHIAESERVLRNEDKFQELIDLYHSKGQHRKGTYSVVCEDVMCEDVMCEDVRM